jgi:hypothetical protein
LSPLSNIRTNSLDTFPNHRKRTKNLAPSPQGEMVRVREKIDNSPAPRITLINLGWVSGQIFEQIPQSFSFVGVDTGFYM